MFRLARRSIGHFVKKLTFSFLVIFGVAGVAALGGCASPGQIYQTTAIPALNAEKGLALKGYDPVAYFTDARPIEGNPAISADWNGVTWRFASTEHREAFLADPGKYEPQYGGYCAFAISRGQIADIDPEEWATVDDKLYLNNNSLAQKIWNIDRPGNIIAGNRNWPLVPKLPVTR